LEEKRIQKVQYRIRNAQLDEAPVNVIEAIPGELTVYVPMIPGDRTKYDVLIESRSLPHPTPLKNVTLEELREYMRDEGYIVNAREGYDALNTVIHGLRREGLCEVVAEVQEPGF